MLTEPLPVEIFVATRFTEKTITNVTENWRVEPEQLQKMIVNYFREMGIFSVLPSMEEEMNDSLLFWLHNSPEIYQMIKQAEMQEAVRRQSRRPD